MSSSHKKKMVSQGLETQLQNPIFFLNALYCEEEHFEEDLGGFSFEEDREKCSAIPEEPLSLDLFWEDDEIVTLLSKEKLTHFNSGDESLMLARNVAIDWVLRVSSHYAFTPATVVLAVNYFDRFVSRLCFQNDKPWMSQLAAVACLSLASKVEETQVPLLLDFQVEESKFMFDSKSIQRMELLVLSSLEWKMHPVTPFSFIDHIIRRLGLKAYPHWELLRRCERLLLSAITDPRLLCYLPSAVAAATIFLIIKEVDPCNALEYQNQLMGILKVNKEKVDECCNLILGLSGDCGGKQFLNCKRKYCSMPSSSPNGVIGAYFSCDSSNDSWVGASQVSSAPEHPFKKSRAQDQQMRLTPLNHCAH